MTAYLLKIENPFEPQKHVFTAIPAGTAIAAALRRGGIDPETSALPLLYLLNGVPVLHETTPEFPEAKTLAYRLKPQDMLSVVAIPGDFGFSFIVAALSLVVAVAAALLVPTPSNPAQGQESIDPAFTVKGQTNRFRPGEPVEVHYGRARVWPSYAAQPFSFYDGNDNYQTSLFCWGQGEYDFDDFLVEDSPLADFSDVQTEIVLPGAAGALYPGFVFRSGEVQGIELYGTNEDEYGTDGWSTAFVLNPAGTTVERLSIDMVCPQGLFRTADGLYYTTDAQFEVQRMAIDDDGNETGSWVTCITEYFERADPAPQRFTIAADVPAGRYKLRARNTGERSDAANKMNLLHWDGATGLNFSAVSYPGKTTVALKIRATAQLNDSSQRRFNGWATRKLPTWTAGAGWSAPVATRNPVWAFCDIFRAEYGGRLADAYLQMDDLKALADKADALGVVFDWTFDTPITAWEAARATLQALRAVPVPQGSIITVIRDEPAELPAMIFTPENTLKGSFSQELKLWDADAPHSVEVEYFDPQSWIAKTVVCTLPGFVEDTVPKQIKLPGCTSRDLAYQTGLYHLACAMWQNEFVSLETGLEGMVPAYGALVDVSHPTIPRGRGGAVLAWSSATRNMELSEPVLFETGKTYAILLRDISGGAVELPLPCEHPDGGTGETRRVRIPGGIGQTQLVVDVNAAPALYIFGEPGTLAFRGKVTRLAPSSDSAVQVDIAKYDARVYAFENTPAPSGGPAACARPAPGTPGRVKMRRDPLRRGWLILRWQPVADATGYRVEVQHGRHGAWEAVGIVDQPFFSVARPLA